MSEKSNPLSSWNAAMIAATATRLSPEEKVLLIQYLQLQVVKVQMEQVR